MSNGDARDWYLALPNAEKLIALAFVSMQLTIHGRVVGMNSTGEELSRAFIGLNELQHQLSGHIAAIASEGERYPDEVLWNILQEKATYYGLRPHLAQAIHFAKSRDAFARR